ncbi:MAG: hypothetical protein A2X86_02910 [Bdellovibrionales bacterium GWA2_49_15]|nr:MAG: hypothetical protein A2X86_02910 [Bdellovibrionales bacterium GWA2_49_15]
MANPSFLKSYSDRESFFKNADDRSFAYVYEVPKTLGIIELFGQVVAHKVIEIHYITNISGVSLAFLDTLIEFIKDKSFEQLKLLSPREVENYLRDDNATAAFTDETKSIQSIFGLVPLLEKYLIERFGNTKKLSSPDLNLYSNTGAPLLNVSERGRFLELPLIEQMAVIDQVMERFISPALQKDDGDVECVQVSSNWIIVAFQGSCESCGMSHTSTLNFITKILRRELCEPSLLVITDSE